MEYIPQLIIATNGETLIPISEATTPLYCPNCHELVTPTHGHYSHRQCGHFEWTCKNWLLTDFTIEGTHYEAETIEMYHEYETPFGNYIPDVTVVTKSGETIFFEICFENRKRESNYFCKWGYLKTPVVNVTLQEYKTKSEFHYLYKDGICYDKEYLARDLYANTIAKRPNARLNQFWTRVLAETDSGILNSIERMDYEDQVFCYDIVKKMQKTKHLKGKVREIINKHRLNEMALPEAPYLHWELDTKLSVVFEYHEGQINYRTVVYRGENESGFSEAKKRRDEILAFIEQVKAIDNYKVIIDNGKAIIKGLMECEHHESIEIIRENIAKAEAQIKWDKFILEEATQSAVKEYEAANECTLVFLNQRVLCSRENLYFSVAVKELDIEKILGEISAETKRCEKKHTLAQKYVDQINGATNGLWSARLEPNNAIIIKLKKFKDEATLPEGLWKTEKSLKQELQKSMNGLFQYIETSKNIRFLEEE